MLLESTAESRKKARWAHDLFVLNIFFFHLLATPATIMLGLGHWGLLIPLSLSGAVMAFIFFRSKRETDPFIAGHWKLSWKRCRLLVYGYLGSAAIFLIGWLIAQGSQTESMQHIMFTVFTRIAVMPTLILAMVTAVLEAGATGMVNRSEVPDNLAK